MPKSKLTTEQTMDHNRLDTDFPFYARHILKIKTKQGKIIPFVMNTSQKHLHRKLELQKMARGYVRAIILKGRQQGCSTYVGGRYYHTSTRTRGKDVFILSHEDKSTQHLFEMVERFQENAPAAARPKADIANRREYIFKDIDSSYAVGTARNEKVGRSQTVQLFHGSEVAHWEKTDGLETGILQAIGKLPGTEIILESTANGMANMFYRWCMDALKGIGAYQLIFIPWFWQEEYREDTPDDDRPELLETEEFGDEAEHKELYGLDMQQVYWRRNKIIELKSLWKFKQEYPSHVMEAFQTSGDTLIDAEAIMKARKCKVTDPGAPLVLGVDPGRTKDRTIFVWRRGREVVKWEEHKFQKHDNVQMNIAGLIARRIDAMQPLKVFVDVGEGNGVCDRLRERGYTREVEAIYFGSGAMEDELYLNKRAEMWCTMRDWIHRENGEVSIPDDDEFQKDLMSMPGEKITSSNKIQLESKKMIKKLYGMSPDIADALALTFAYPVARTAGGPGFQGRVRKKNPEKSGISVLQRHRKKNKMSQPAQPSIWTRR